jgi:hypothetical protein
MAAIALTMAGLLALVVALLAVPVVLVFEAERQDTLKARWRVRWLFGAVDIRSPRARRTPPSSDRRDVAKPAPTPARTRRKRLRMAIAVVRTRGLLRRVQQLASRLFRRVKLQAFDLHTVFGLDNPADTGLAYGFLAPLLVMAEARGLNIECRPMFLESGLRGTCNVTLHARPLSVVGALMAFLASPAVIRAAVAAWRART